MVNEGARRVNDEMEPEVEITDDDSLVADRSPKAPAMQRLGRYRIVCELASGGMATVNLAIADGLDKLLALKVIHPHLAKEESFVKMFLDEARIASSVSHRNVCNVFDYGEQDGSYYMAMDYLAGTTLRDVIRRLRGKRGAEGSELHPVYLAYIIAQACEGLHAAHELRDNQGELMEVVHRDVSPHNLFVTFDGNVSVVDFGIARASDRLQQTATGVLKGKFSYMAPEQIRQTRVDRRADIWALGVCLWEALTQRRLFARATQADTLMSVMVDPIKPPSELEPKLSRSLDSIVGRALSRNAEERYQTAREMGRDLMAFCRECGVSMSPLEIEHFMEELFPKERVRSRELVRRAKTSAAEDIDMYMGGLTHSGAMLRHPLARAQGTHGGTPVSRVGYTGSFAPHEAAARSTAAPNEPTPRSRGFLWGAVSAGVLGVGLFFAFARSQPTPVPLAHEVAAPAVERAQPEPQAPAPAAIAVQPAPKPQAAPREEYDAQAEPEEARSGAQPSARYQPARNARGAGRGRPSHDDTQVEANVKQEAKAALAEIEPVEPKAASVEPAEPKPTAEVAVSPSPVAVPKPAAAVAVEKPSLPKADNRPLDANVSFTNVQAQGSLGSGVVSRMLSRTAPLMRTCYQSAARSALRNDFAALQLTFSIDETGGVRNAKGGSHPLPGLANCVADSLKRVRSDQKPDVGIVKVEVQVSFRGL